jgi:hypothetical protein
MQKKEKGKKKKFIKKPIVFTEKKEKTPLPEGYRSILKGFFPRKIKLLKGSFSEGRFVRRKEAKVLGNKVANLFSVLRRTEAERVRGATLGFFSANFWQKNFYIKYKKYKKKRRGQRSKILQSNRIRKRRIYRKKIRKTFAERLFFKNYFFFNFLKKEFKNKLLGGDKASGLRYGKYTGIRRSFFVVFRGEYIVGNYDLFKYNIRKRKHFRFFFLFNYFFYNSLRYLVYPIYLKILSIENENKFKGFFSLGMTYFFLRFFSGKRVSFLLNNLQYLKQRRILHYRQKLFYFNYFQIKDINLKYPFLLKKDFVFSQFRLFFQTIKHKDFDDLFHYFLMFNQFHLKTKFIFRNLSSNYWTKMRILNQVVAGGYTVGGISKITRRKRKEKKQIKIYKKMQTEFDLDFFRKNLIAFQYRITYNENEHRLMKVGEVKRHIKDYLIVPYKYFAYSYYRATRKRYLGRGILTEEAALKGYRKGPHLIKKKIYKEERSVFKKNRRVHLFDKKFEKRKLQYFGGVGQSFFIGSNDILTLNTEMTVLPTLIPIFWDYIVPTLNPTYLEFFLKKDSDYLGKLNYHTFLQNKGHGPFGWFQDFYFFFFINFFRRLWFKNAEFVFDASGLDNLMLRANYYNQMFVSFFFYEFSDYRNFLSVIFYRNFYVNYKKYMRNSLQELISEGIVRPVTFFEKGIFYLYSVKGSYNYPYNRRLFSRFGHVFRTNFYQAEAIKNKFRGPTKKVIFKNIVLHKETLEISLFNFVNLFKFLRVIFFQFFYYLVLNQSFITRYRVYFGYVSAVSFFGRAHGFAIRKLFHTMGMVSMFSSIYFYESGIFAKAYARGEMLEWVENFSFFYKKYCNYFYKGFIYRFYYLLDIFFNFFTREIITVSKIYLDPLYQTFFSLFKDFSDLYFVKENALYDYKDEDEDEDEDEDAEKDDEELKVNLDTEEVFEEFGVAERVILAANTLFIAEEEKIKARNKYRKRLNLPRVDEENKYAPKGTRLAKISQMGGDFGAKVSLEVNEHLEIEIGQLADTAFLENIYEFQKKLQVA